MDSHNGRDSWNKGFANLARLTPNRGRRRVLRSRVQALWVRAKISDIGEVLENYLFDIERPDYATLAKRLAHQRSTKYVYSEDEIRTLLAMVVKSYRIALEELGEERDFDLDDVG